MNSTHRVLSVAALALIAGSAFGQPAQNAERRAERRQRQAERQPATTTPATPPAQEDATPRSTVLRGPEMAPPDGSARPERPAAPRFQIVMGAVRALNRAEDESLHLTEAQTASLRTIFNEHREATRAFMEEHRDEIAKMRESAGRPGRPERRTDEQADPMGTTENHQAEPDDMNPGDRRGPGPRPNDRPGTRPDDGFLMERGPDDGRSNPGARAARERFQAFLAAAPHNEETIKKLIELLTPEQRAHVTEAMQAQRERAEAGGEEARPDGTPRRRIEGQRERRENGAERTPAQRPDIDN